MLRLKENVQQVYISCYLNTPHIVRMQTEAYTTALAPLEGKTSNSLQLSM